MISERAGSKNFVFRHKVADGCGEPSLPCGSLKVEHYCPRARVGNIIIERNVLFISNTGETVSNILKKEARDFLKIFLKNKGIVIYVIVLSLFIFLISLTAKSKLLSVAYLVCSLGSLFNLKSCDPSNEENQKKINEVYDIDTVCEIKKIFYVVVLTIVSFGFLFVY